MYDRYTGLYEKSQGGTETKYRELFSRLPVNQLQQYQIICSRIQDFDGNKKYKIFWAHDLPGDPEAFKLRDKNILSKLNKIVFVSHTQFQQYRLYHDLSYDECTVIPNAIDTSDMIDHKELFENKRKEEKIRLIYHTTPHRGLELLIPVYEYLYKKYGEKIHLDVFSSFEIYGWKERDKPYQELFDICNSHSGITYHGFKPNGVVREHLRKSHIFAFPSIWEETSCVAAIEAMHEGCLIVAPKYGALSETVSENYNMMYDFTEDKVKHANRFLMNLDVAIESMLLNQETVQKQFLTPSREMITMKHSWKTILPIWKNLLEEIRLNGF